MPVKYFYFFPWLQIEVEMQPLKEDKLPLQRTSSEKIHCWMTDLKKQQGKKAQSYHTFLMFQGNK